MSQQFNVAVLGASGAVGQAMIEILEERAFPVATLYPLASSRSAGDTVRFLPTMSGHNAASVPGLLPQGAQAFKSKLNQPYEHQFSVPGVYGIQCIPHLAMGMVMVIQVGDAAPAELPANLPARAQARFAAQLQKLGAGQ